MNDNDMWRWHVEFERQNPQAHQEFLVSLVIPEQEAAEIRKQSRNRR